MQPRTQEATAQRMVNPLVRRTMLRDHLYAVVRGQRRYFAYQVPGGAVRQPGHDDVQVLSGALAATVRVVARGAEGLSSDDDVLEHLQRELWGSARRSGVIAGHTQRQRLVSEWCDAVAHAADLIMSEEERLLRGSVD